MATGQSPGGHLGYPWLLQTCRPASDLGARYSGHDSPSPTTVLGHEWLLTITVGRPARNDWQSPRGRSRGFEGSEAAAVHEWTPVEEDRRVGQGGSVLTEVRQDVVD